MKYCLITLALILGILPFENRAHGKGLMDCDIRICFDELLSNPTVNARVRFEIESVVGSRPDGGYSLANINMYAFSSFMIEGEAYAIRSYKLTFSLMRHPPIEIYVSLQIGPYDSEDPNIDKIQPAVLVSRTIIDIENYYK